MFRIGSVIPRTVGSRRPGHNFEIETALATASMKNPDCAIRTKTYYKMMLADL